MSADPTTAPILEPAADSRWFGDPCDQAAYRQAAISKAAYLRAQQRGFAPGHELEDWVAAERELQNLPEHSGSPPDPRAC